MAMLILKSTFKTTEQVTIYIILDTRLDSTFQVCSSWPPPTAAMASGTLPLTLANTAPMASSTKLSLALEQAPVKIAILPTGLSVLLASKPNAWPASIHTFLSIVRASSIALLSALAVHSTPTVLLGTSVLDVRTDTIFKITGNAILDAEMECLLAEVRAVMMAILTIGTGVLLSVKYKQTSTALT